MSGKRKFKNPKKTYGHGLNDADYVTKVKSSGWVCPFFLTWKNMLKRAYSSAEHARRPSYIGTTICNEWMSFIAFKKWMEAQDWKGKQLDKDLLVPGNMEYRPDRCCFISHQVNSFLTDSEATRGGLPIGVSLHKKTGKYVAQIQVCGVGKKHIGLFENHDHAHQAWLGEKHALSLILAGSEQDSRISTALATRYSSGYRRQVKS
ncbi:hypothetical protein D3C81_1026130 [compost metagenome]